MQTTDTIGRVPRPRGVLSEETLEALAERKEELAYAQENYRWTVIGAVEEGSFSAVAEATGLSKDTLQRWKREARVERAAHNRKINRASVAAAKDAGK